MNKKILMLTCASVLMLGASVVWAQDTVSEPMTPPPAPEMQAPKGDMHKMRAEKLAKELGLNDEQRKKAEEIRKADFEKMKPLMEEMKALREKMDNMRQENMKSFEAILTPEQLAKFKQIVDEHKRKMDERGPHHHGRHPGMEPRPIPEDIHHK